MKYFKLFLIVLTFSVFAVGRLYAQQEEQVNYFQMEPLDDSLFIHIQQEVFIDPPDPKAEIIADLRDPNNQALSIKGVIFPFLAFKPDTRAKIQVYPFKLNLGESINYGSVFTRVLDRIKIKKLVAPPSVYQISSVLQYINPFLQIFGGERFGFPIKSDIGLSFGSGTAYSGPLETNFIEANFHIDGASINWEFRYPISVLGSTRGKIYAGQYLNEWHIGYTGRELSLAGSTFDFRFDAMPHSDIREPQFVVDFLVQKIFDSWSFSAIAIGPSATFGNGGNGKFTCTSLFLNFRLKIGTSL